MLMPAIKRLALNQVTVSAIVFILAVVVGISLITGAPSIKRTPITLEAPSTIALRTTRQTHTIFIKSRGRIHARAKVNLTAQVKGEVTFLHPMFVNGGFFKKGERLLSLDKSHYRLQLISKKSAVASARLLLEKTRANAKVARSTAQQDASPIALYVPQLAEAKAKLEAAIADFKLSELQLQQTDIIAPFDGRILNTDLNMGQYVAIGNTLGSIYAVGAFEIRLPVSAEQLQMIDTALIYNNSNDSDKGSDIIFEAQVGTVNYQWSGKVVRLESGLDEHQRYFLVGTISHPIGNNTAFGTHPPIEPGMYLEANIKGRTLDNVFALPNSAIRNQSVWRVNNQLRLELQPVTILYRSHDVSYVSEGIKEQDRIVVSPDSYLVTGQRVNPRTSNTMAASIP